MATILDFTVTGEEKIHCEGCEQRISNALKRLPGVEDVRASAQTQHVTVTLDPARTSPDQVGAKLAQLGYEVTPQGESR
ncbi:MAG: heavy-metal-associated domain-containing protein [Dehalococcoidia bacterium]